MGKLRIYEINAGYIDYLAAFITHLFHNKKSEQQNERKYIGIQDRERRYHASC
ncbi:hypothetical protein II898_09025 [bacterium]|nr:hypothetical protein [bacterium]